MAWIESHETLAEHPKTKRLAKRLSVDFPTAVGHLHYLWWWSLKYAQDGDLSAFESDELADAARWSGDCELFIQAMIQAGFIDEDMALHDWYDYAGKLIEQREKNAERMRNARERKKSERAEHVQNTFNARAPATVPNLTVPNHTIPNTERELAVQQIIKAYEETFGPLRGEPNQLMTLLDYMDKGMELELIVTAIHKSSMADSPMKYADGILSKQLRKGILTVEDSLQEVASGGERSEYPRRSGTSASDGPPARKRIVDTPGAY